MMFIIENCNLQENVIMITAKEAKNRILFKSGYSKSIKVILYWVDPM